MGHIFMAVIAYMVAIFIFFAIMIPMVNFAVWINSEKFSDSWIAMIFSWTIAVWGAVLGGAGGVWFLLFTESLLK